MERPYRSWLARCGTLIRRLSVRYQDTNWIVRMTVQETCIPYLTAVAFSLLLRFHYRPDNGHSVQLLLALL